MSLCCMHGQNLKEEMEKVWDFPGVRLGQLKVSQETERQLTENSSARCRSDPHVLHHWNYRDKEYPCPLSRSLFISQPPIIHGCTIFLQLRPLSCMWSSWFSTLNNTGFLYLDLWFSCLDKESIFSAGLKFSNLKTQGYAKNLSRVNFCRLEFILIIHIMRLITQVYLRQSKFCTQATKPIK